VTVVTIDFVYGLRTVPLSEKRGSQANNKVCIIIIILRVCESTVVQI
jgi:hypothetical protein